MSGHWQLKGPRWAVEVIDTGNLLGYGVEPRIYYLKRGAVSFQKRYCVNSKTRVVKVRVKYEEIT